MGWLSGWWLRWLRVGCLDKLTRSVVTGWPSVVAAQTPSASWSRSSAKAQQHASHTRSARRASAGKACSKASAQRSLHITMPHHLQHDMPCGCIFKWRSFTIPRASKPTCAPPRRAACRRATCSGQTRPGCCHHQCCRRMRVRCVTRHSPSPVPAASARAPERNTGHRDRRSRSTHLAIKNSVHTVQTHACKCQLCTR